MLLLLAMGGTGFSLAVSLGLAALAAVTALQGEAIQAFFPIWAAAAFGALGLVGLPAIYWAGRGLLGGTPAVRGRPRPVWALGVALFPLSLLLGYLAFETEALPQGFGLLAHLLAAGAPVLIAASVGLQFGPGISIRRSWGHFLAGLWAVPPVSMVLELLGLVPVILLLILGLSLTAEGQALIDFLSASTIASDADLEQVLGALVSQPWLLLLLAGYLCVVVPLLEEGLKTMVVWPLLGRGLTPAEAFLGGLLGGTGYALFESLFLPQPGGDWTATMLARAGTPLIHGLSTAVTCWGLAQAIGRGRWTHLLGAYTAAATLHGSWNLAAIALGLSGVLPELGMVAVEEQTGMVIGVASGAVLVGFSLLALLALIYLPRRLVNDRGQAG